MAFAFVLLNCFCLGPWDFFHLVSILSPAAKSGVIGHLTSVQGQPTTPHYSRTGSLSFWKSSHSVHSRKQCSSLRLLWFLSYEKDKNYPVAKSFSFCKSLEPLSVDFLMRPLSDDQISANWLCFQGNNSLDKPVPFNSRWHTFYNRLIIF